MPTASAKLARVRARFEKTRKAQEDFLRSLPSLEKRAGSRCVAISSRQQETLCEMAFVVLFTAWEQFLENTFETYVVEAPLSSFKSRHRVLVVDMETAHALIRGSRKYVEWSEPQTVRERATVFFKRGEPFESALSSVADDLKNMKVIRNRCVHFSRHSIDQYEKMLRRVFGSGQKMSPGKLLMDAPPPGLSAVANVKTYNSVFTFYSEILATAVSQIISEKH